jgi:hypothetical protein
MEAGRCRVGQVYPIVRTCRASNDDNSAVPAAAVRGFLAIVMARAGTPPIQWTEALLGANGQDDD